MRKNRGFLLIIAIVGGLAWWLWPSSGGDDRSVRAASDLDDVFYNRFWIDRVPEAMTDKIDVFVLADPQIGAFQRTSAYEGDYTLFEWATPGAGHLRITMLQTQERHALHYGVSDRGCGAFDYCARVDGAPRGATRYFSMEDWVLGAGEAADMASLRARVFQALSREGR